MKKRQTYSIYQFTWRDLQRSQKKKKVIIFQPKNFPGKQYPRKQTSTKPEKETEKPLDIDIPHHHHHDQRAVMEKNCEWIF